MLPEHNACMQSGPPRMRSMHARFLGLHCVAGPQGCHQAPWAAAQHTSAMPTMCATGPLSTPANDGSGQPEDKAPLDCTRLHSELQTRHGATTGARRKGALTAFWRFHSTRCGVRAPTGLLRICPGPHARAAAPLETAVTSCCVPPRGVKIERR